MSFKRIGVTAAGIVISRVAILGACACLTAACGSWAPQPYRIDVRQGNYVTQEMVSQLRPGMTREQVRFVLGTPLVADVFHGDRWDYVYRLQPGRGEAQQRVITVFFAEGKLARVAGDVVAARAADGAAGAEVEAAGGTRAAPPGGGH